MSQATVLPTSGRRTLSDWCIGLPTIAMLLLVLVIGTGEMIHGQLLRFGETFFGDKSQQVQYFMLRAEPVKPTCDAHMNIDAEVNRRMAAQPAGGGDAIDNLFADEALDANKLRQSLNDTLAQCQEKHAWYERAASHNTWAVKAYRTVETSFFGLFRFGSENRPMILLLLMGFTSAWCRHATAATTRCRRGPCCWPRPSRCTPPSATTRSRWMPACPWKNR